MILPDAPTNGTAGNRSGVGVWDSQPEIDAERNQVFATGNVYTVPEAYFACAPEDDPEPGSNGVVSNANANNESSCYVLERIWQEAALALDITTGKSNWIRRLYPLDAWTLACGVPDAIPKNSDPAVCPQTTPGPDADIGMAPAFVPGNPRHHDTHNMKGSWSKTKTRDLVTVGQKNGILYVLDAATGEVE